jgi:hypothetical protein
VTATEFIRNVSTRPAHGRHCRSFFPIIMAVLAAGCGGAPSTTNPAVTGPHGTPAIPIPGGLGYGEARVEPASETASRQGPKRQKTKPSVLAISGPSPSSGASRIDLRKGSSARIVVYFLDPDGKTPLTPLPEKVQAVIGLPGTYANKYTKAYDLTNEPRTADPVASARFASVPFKLPEQRITGRVKAVLQGQEVSFPLVLSGVSIR